MEFRSRIPARAALTRSLVPKPGEFQPVTDPWLARELQRQARGRGDLDRPGLERHRDLKLSYAESQIGWLPYILERADKLWAERGDNEFGTDDSRVYGVADVIGRVSLRYWPRPGRLS